LRQKYEKENLLGNEQIEPSASSSFYDNIKKRYGGGGIFGGTSDSLKFAESLTSNNNHAKSFTSDEWRQKLDQIK